MWLPVLYTWVIQGAKCSISGLRRTEAIFVNFMLDSSRTLILYCNLLAFFIIVMLTLACAWGQAHSSLFELSALIGQLLNSWRVISENILYGAYSVFDTFFPSLLFILGTIHSLYCKWKFLLLKYFVATWVPVNKLCWHSYEIIIGIFCFMLAHKGTYM
jgi:hypothetical protein